MSKETLSWKALGLLFFIRNELHVGNELNEDYIVSMASDGRDSVRAGLKELEDDGVLKRTRKRDSTGCFAGYEWEVKYDD